MDGRWMVGGIEDGWMEVWRDGWKDGWMDIRMERWMECRKKLKLGIYILYAKKIYEGRRIKYISKKKMKIIWGFIFPLSKRNI